MDSQYKWEDTLMNSNNNWNHWMSTKNVGYNAERISASSSPHHKYKKVVRATELTLFWVFTWSSELKNALYASLSFNSLCNSSILQRKVWWKRYEKFSTTVKLCIIRKKMNIVQIDKLSMYTIRKWKHSKTNQPCINVPYKIIQQLSTGSPTPSIMF